MKHIVVSVLLSLVVLSGLAQAQGVTPPPATTPTLSDMTVSLWPEYDRPEMLVLMAGQFGAAATSPLPVEIRIPASAGKPSAVAYVGSGNQLLTEPYTTRVEGDRLVVSFDLPTSGFQLEYYAPLAIDGVQRTFVYSYTADYPTTLLYLSAQVPPTAQDYALDPPAASVAPGDDGLTYHQTQSGPLAVGESRSWKITYQKADSSLTAGAAQASPAPTAVPTTGGGPGNSTALVFLIAFVALVGVAAGAFWLGRRAQPTLPTDLEGQRPAGSRGTGGPGAAGRTAADRGGHCYQCGARLRPDADYCHKCGAKARKV